MESGQGQGPQERLPSPVGLHAQDPGTGNTAPASRKSNSYRIQCAGCTVFCQRRAKPARPLPQEPNWMQLAEDNPAQYAVEREAWNKRVSDLNQVRQMRVQHEQAANEQRQAAIAQAQVEAYNNLVQLHPEFARTAEGKVSPASTELVNFAVNEVGFSEQTVGADHRRQVFSVLYDAMRYRRSQAQQPKALQAVANKPPLAKPGVATGKANARTDRSQEPDGASQTNRQCRRRCKHHQQAILTLKIREPNNKEPENGHSRYQLGRSRT